MEVLKKGRRGLQLGKKEGRRSTVPTCRSPSTAWGPQRHTDGSNLGWMVESSVRAV